MRLALEFGLWSQPGVTVAAPDPATGADLELIYDAPYVTAVEAVSRWAWTGLGLWRHRRLSRWRLSRRRTKA